ncbi:hypothetical protein NA66_100684 [Burkholderia pyrrocinia]|uniref:Uncharacterized protein n=2 Tax=Burkholderia TaxID=32008 RepID=A0A318IRW1_BURPY|nr:hypothetical protein NA66_100684 [Burkholderia pyrrocinia]SFW41834.1 hypothetical protein SAMN03159384_01915 [Burkholderia sp. NFACC33-1]SFX71243.1 hypothetical protein SAMN03159408_01997 [Burkholderia sp. NFPP32]
MSVAPTATGHSHDDVPAETAAAPRRDGAPSAFAQTLRRLERDMWRGAAAGPAPRAQTSRPLAPLCWSSSVAPSVGHTADSSPVIRAPFETTAPQPGTWHRTHAQLGSVVSDRPTHTPSRPLPPAGDDSPPDTLARPLSATSTAAFYRARPAPGPQPAHVANQRARASEHGAAAPPCTLSVLMGETGISVAIRAAGIDDATLARRTFTELRRLGLPDLRLFINGRLFIATNPLPGGTHGD